MRIILHNTHEYKNVLSGNLLQTKM